MYEPRERLLRADGALHLSSRPPQQPASTWLHNRTQDGWHQHNYYTQGYVHAYTQISKHQALPLESKGYVKDPVHSSKENAEGGSADSVQNNTAMRW